MGVKRDMIEMAAFSAVMVLLAVAGIIWDALSRLLFNGVDGILLLLVCLMLGAIFGMELRTEIRQLFVARAPSSVTVTVPTAGVTPPAKATSAPAASRGEAAQ
jgi:hypothetical protein